MDEGLPQKDRFLKAVDIAGAAVEISSIEAEACCEFQAEDLVLISHISLHILCCKAVKII